MFNFSPAHYPSDKVSALCVLISPAHYSMIKYVSYVFYYSPAHFSSNKVSTLCVLISPAHYSTIKYVPYCFITALRTTHSIM